MKNISVLAVASLAAGGLLTVGAPITGSSAFAQQKTYTLKVASFTPKRSATSRWFEATKIDLAKKSGGRLNLEMYYGSAMGPMPRHYDLARTGVADLAFFQHGVTRGRFPLTELTHSPYLVPSGAKGSLVATQIAADLKSTLEKEHKGTRLIWIVYNRPSGIYETKKPIHSVADLKGRRYRAPTPTDVAMLKALGALPIGMPATHMAESLQKGTIDGVVTDPMGIFSFKLGTLVKHYTPMFVSVISFGLVMNPKSYDRLPADLQKLIDALGTKESAIKMAKMSWSDFPRFVEYQNKLKLNRIPLSAAADKEMRALANKVMDKRITKMEKKGLPARATYTKMKALAAKYSK
jgi:TRAP-type C4-dicarboxylate transport system substrate-binding protein